MKSGVMQKIVFLTFLFSVYAITSYSEMSHYMGSSFSDTIEIRKKAGGYQFYQAGGQLNMKQLQKMMKTNGQAYKKLRSGRSSNTVATILGYTGGFLIGWPLGTAIGGGDPNWTMAGIGAGLAALSIPVNQSAKKKLRNAVNTYNQTSQSSSRLQAKELTLQSSNNRIGLVLKF